MLHLQKSLMTEAGRDAVSAGEARRGGGVLHLQKSLRTEGERRRGLFIA